MSALRGSGLASDGLTCGGREEERKGQKQIRAIAGCSEQPPLQPQWPEVAGEL
jgi:hypothetical protein